MNNINTEILNFLTYSKNLITNQPYQITFNGDTVCMFKLFNCERNLKYILRIRLNATVGWITKTDRLCGFIIHVGNKQKKFYSDDSSILLKLLACKVSFYNVYEFYDFKEQIGKGASSRVVKAFCKFTHRFVAIKIIDKTTLKPLNYASLEQEIEILLKVKDSIYCSQIIEIYQSQYAFYIVMRLLSGQSLSTYLENQQGEVQKKLTSKQILQIMRRLLEGVNYLHSVGIIHRDIKPDNLMLAEQDNFDTITLIDFGLSTFTKINRYLFYKCGTPGYVAPEILNSAVRNQQSESCDIFSCGCIFYRLITGKMYLRAEHTMNYSIKINNAQLTLVLSKNSIAIRMQQNYCIQCQGRIQMNEQQPKLPYKVVTFIMNLSSQSMMKIGTHLLLLISYLILRLRLAKYSS